MSINHACTSGTSRYFNPVLFDQGNGQDEDPCCQRKQRVTSEKRIKEEKLFSQPLIPGTCLIAQRLQTIKESQTR